MTTIHWCGTGLSSGPGLRRLIESGHKVVVWNRTVSKAQEVVGTLTTDIRPYTLDALTAALEPGDIAISMLPADQHVGIAKACLAKGANFVSSSYIAPEMRALDPEFKAKGLVSVNEVGLDPGIDHHHVELALDPFDRRQKMHALQAVRVEHGRRVIRGHHQNDPLGKQAIEQATENHCIGNIRNVKFIKTKQADITRNLLGDF